MHCDAILWKHGELANGRGTKVGGAAWGPLAEKGDPAVSRFLFQLDFADSLDVVSRVPAPLLQVFCAPEDEYFMETPLVLRWRRHDQLEVVTSPVRTAPLRGVLVRTSDNPYYGCLREAPSVPDRHREVALIKDMAKIGGVASMTQTWYPYEEYEDGEAFIGQVEAFDISVRMKTYRSARFRAIP